MVELRLSMANSDAEKLPDQHPPYGHTLLPFFSHSPNYLNLSHGAYGSLPKTVFEAHNALLKESESIPDLFMRRTYLTKLNHVRERLAKMLRADSTDEVVMVINTTLGINTVMRNIEWTENDVIVGNVLTFTTPVVKYLLDTHPKLRYLPFQLEFPTTSSSILKTFKSHLQSIPRTNTNTTGGPNGKIVVLIDAIISTPGLRLPWEEMVKICKEEGALSVVDAAHCIGQIDVDLSVSKPDFWVSNCHKWLYTKRAAAVFYVPKRNQHLIKTTLPTSLQYVSPNDPPVEGGPKPPNFVAQFSYPGTIDYIPFITVDPALDFREWLGGEVEINRYCHQLALDGAQHMKKLLKTKLLDETGEFTANMFNVALPFPSPAQLSPPHRKQLSTFIEDRLLLEYSCFASVFIYKNEWWMRLSAQVYNEISDFETMGQTVLKLQKDVDEFLETLGSK